MTGRAGFIAMTALRDEAARHDGQPQDLAGLLSQYPSIDLTSMRSHLPGFYH
jgi:hypothetical protein